MLKNLRALCLSEKCAGYNNKHQKFVIKEVKVTETFCPDCKSALFWTTEDKGCHFSSKAAGFKKTREFNLNGKDSF